MGKKPGFSEKPGFLPILTQPFFAPLAPGMRKPQRLRAARMPRGDFYQPRRCIIRSKRWASTHTMKYSGAWKGFFCMSRESSRLPSW